MAKAQPSRRLRRRHDLLGVQLGLFTVAFLSLSLARLPSLSSAADSAPRRVLSAAVANQTDLSLVAALAGTAECTTPFDTGGGILVFFGVVLYTFVGLAVVCDDYFCESLERISEALSLSEDVAGATFMAAGSSAPELFTALVTIFVAPGDSGVGTIVGSAVFNLCVIVGLSALCAGQVLDLFWWPLTRDSAVYFVSIVLMLAFMADGQVTLGEGAVLTAGYFLYLAIMVLNPRIVDYIEGGVNRKVQLSDELAAAPADKMVADGVDVEMTSSTTHASPSQSDGAAASDEGHPASAEANQDNERKEEGDEDEGPTTLAGKAWAAATRPMVFMLEWTIPDCREPRWETWYIGTFTMSIVWIGLLSFFMVDFATRAACVLHIEEIVIGLVVLSVGTSVPDALSSVIVAKQGKGSMAVCNAIGSNVFNILLGLGLPWMIKAANDGKPVIVPDFAEIGEPLILLLLYLALFLTIIKAGQWKLSPQVGAALLIAQAFYTLWTLLRHLPSGSPIINF